MKVNAWALARAISDGQFINCPTPADVEINRATRAKIAVQIGNALTADNPGFNGAGFLLACGINADAAPFSLDHTD